MADSQHMQMFMQEIKRELNHAVEMSENIANIDIPVVQDYSANWERIAIEAMSRLQLLAKSAQYDKLSADDLDDIAQEVLDETNSLGSQINDAKQVYARRIEQALNQYEDMIIKRIDELESLV